MAVQEIIEGNVGKINELKTLGNDNAVLNISIANTPSRKEGDNWVDDETIWTDVTLWGKLATNVANSAIKPGTPVLVVGKRKARRVEAYTSQSGQEFPERVVQSITADHFAVQVNNWHLVTETDKAAKGSFSGASNNNSSASKTAPKQTQTQKDDIFDQTAPATNTDDIFGGSDSADDDDIFGDF